MLSLRMIARSIVGLVLLVSTALCLFPDSACAQRNKPGRGQGAQSKAPQDPIQGSGFIHGWAMDKSGTVTVKVKLGELDWTLKTAKNSKLRVVGTADFEFIRPGMYIQALALLDPKGTVVKEVPKVTIITPVAAEKPKEPPRGAAAAAASVAAAAKVPNEFELGCFPDNSGVNQFVPQENAGSQFFNIRGQVKSVGNNRALLVEAPVGGRMARFNIKVGAEAEIDFNIADLSVVKKDDEFQLVRGNRDVPGQNVGTLFEATIKHMEPVSGATSKKKPGAEKAKPGEKDGENK